jgi:hypothetical protein
MSDLQVGDVLLFEEVVIPHTGQSGDASPRIAVGG